MLNKAENNVIKEYIEASNQYLEADKKKKRLRPKLLEILNEQEVPEIEFNKRQRIVFNDERFYDWVAATWPSHIEHLSTKTIDYVEFERYVAEGIIEYDELPPEVYTSKIEEVIKVKV